MNLRLSRKQTGHCEGDKINLEPLQDMIKNVVVFGESGVGKSSLINLLAGKKVCETSSGALGCTLEYRRYQLQLDDQQFAIWDTAGLDEGTQGSVPADKAEAYLKQLLHELVKNNGIDLLIYCVRGTRVRSALLTNYHIFYSAICRKKVPIAIVITGLENQEGSMETWWHKNESQFTLLKMYFGNHACVTTLESSVENALLKQRRETSRADVTKVITSACRTQQWKPSERSWIESAYSDIRTLLSPRENSSRLATIIMCETSRGHPSGRLTRKRSISFQNPVALPLCLHPFSLRSPISISNDSSRNRLPFEEAVKYTPGRLYRIYHVSPVLPPPSNVPDEEIRKVSVVKRGAALLIFCVRMEETKSKATKFQWEHFNFTYGGDLSPQIVVVIGATNKHAAEKWWEDTVGSLSRNDVDVAYWPTDATAVAEVEAARGELQYLIQDRSIDFSKVTFTRHEKPFRRSLLLDMSFLTTLWGRPEYNSKEDGSQDEPDILTKLGVWCSVEDRSPSTTSPLSPLFSW